MLWQSRYKFQLPQHCWKSESATEDIEMHDSWISTLRWVTWVSWLTASEALNRLPLLLECIFSASHNELVDRSSDYIVGSPPQPRFRAEMPVWRTQHGRDTLPMIYAALLPWWLPQINHVGIFHSDLAALYIHINLQAKEKISQVHTLIMWGKSYLGSRGGGRRGGSIGKLPNSSNNLSVSF